MFKIIPKFTLLFVTTVLCFASVVMTAENLSTATPKIWVTDSMERISPNDSPGDSTKIELYAARGEYESFQIGIKAPQNKTVESANIPIELIVSDLSSRDGKVIPRQNITLYQEHYVYLDRPSPQKLGGTNPSLGKGWYPDALIPLSAVREEDSDLVSLNLKGDLAKGEALRDRNQPIWVDILIPRDTIADRYQGKFTIKSDRKKISGDIDLKVWDFELPLKPSLDSAFLLWNHRSKQAAIELLKHKIMPVTKIKPEYQRELIEEWGLTSLRLPFWSGADVDNCSMKPAPSPEEIKSAAEKNESDLSLYVYAVDEVDRCTNLQEPLKQWGENIEKAGFKHLAVMAPVPELYDYVDIWVINPRRYAKNPDNVAEVLARGQEVWFYNALVPDNYSPKWQLDFSPMNYRIPHGFINQSLGMTGVLYWAVDYWEGNPWQSLDYPHKDKNFPGEGLLVYPGEQVGVAGLVPSMRLKWIREGVEDYEYIEILKQLGLEDWALEISRSVGADWKNWTQSTQRLARARIELGNKIEEVSS